MLMPWPDPGVVAGARHGLAWFSARWPTSRECQAGSTKLRTAPLDHPAIES